MWFTSYLSDRCQGVLASRSTVPQCSILGPLLFIIYLNYLCDDEPNAVSHFYSDDTVIYCSSLSKLQWLERLQCRLSELKLVLNADKSAV